MQQVTLSKILVGTAMIGFFGIFSPNTAAIAVECHSLHTPHDCESNSACYWIHPISSGCVGAQVCNGLNESQCNETPGCHMDNPRADAGFCGVQGHTY